MGKSKKKYKNTWSQAIASMIGDWAFEFLFEPAMFILLGAIVGGVGAMVKGHGFMGILAGIGAGAVGGLILYLVYLGVLKLIP